MSAGKDKSQNLLSRGRGYSESNMSYSLKEVPDQRRKSLATAKSQSA